MQERKEDPDILLVFVDNGNENVVDLKLIFCICIYDIIPFFGGFALCLRGFGPVVRGRAIARRLPAVA